MSWYPYTCLEQQRLTRGRAARREALWQRDGAAAGLLDRDGLLKYFPTDRIDGDDALTAYVLAIANEAGYGFRRGEQRAHDQALTRFVAGRSRAARRCRHAGLGDPQARGHRSARALRRRRQPQMLDSITIEPELVADVGGDRLARHRQARPEVDARRRDARIAERRRFCARG